MPVLACVADGMYSEAAAADWTGAYIAGGLGADAVTGEVDAVVPGTGGGSAEGLGGGDIGLSLRVGLDYQVSRQFVVGAFANLDWSNVETSAFATDGTDSLDATLLKLDHSWSIGARAGILVTPSLLAYGLVGYTRVAFDDPSVSVTGFGSVAFSLPTYHGVVYGGGFEHRLTDRVSLFGEYRQARFEKEILFDDPGVLTVRGAPTLHVGRVGVAWRFNGGPDQDEPASAAAPVRSWSGLYAGAGVGADAVTRDLTADIPGIGATAGLEGLGGGDVGGTVTVGYDHRIGPQIVLGLFGLVDVSRQETKISASGFGQTVSAELLHLDQSWTIGGRAGLLIAEDVLAYVLAGYTRTEFSDITVSGGGQTAQLRFSAYDGYTLGGGFEKVLSEALSLRAEYRYTALGEKDLLDVPGTATISMDPSLHTARVMLAYRFATGD